MDPGYLDADSIFTAALLKTSPEERAAYLDEACGGDIELRRRVERRLEQRLEAADSFPKRGTPGLAETEVRPITEGPGTQIGPYKLLQQLGEGGMGVVYMAEQTEPVERRVALKIIKPGMDTRQVIARFAAERQALAMMDHPNIAKVHDAGTTESGRPYFVMELVRGIPITKYCDRQRLTPKERLELFATVCQAVQHAHHKGIIHRDLKPSNVLIALYDGKPVPKIIDFGLVKATNQKLTEKTMFTQYGQIVGTLEYMSPEQAELNQLDVDTRSDIYSLGVLLYELLTGETPFDRQRLRSAALDEMLRILREEEPPRPSLKLTSSQSLPSIAANRHTEPKKLNALVRGELDWIVMKALEKDRTRRYETANAFAADIAHYLNDEPVQACPPSPVYRFRKIVRRNKRLAATFGLILVTLTLGILGTSWQAWRAGHERDRAVEAEGIAAARLEAEEEARKEADSARRAESLARADAENASRERRRSLVRLYVREGTDLVDRGDHTSALPWFLKALALDDEDPDREKIHRLRIATTLDRCPKLTQVWFPDHRVDRVECFADGRRALLSGDGQVSVWDLEDGSPTSPQLQGSFARLSPDGDRIVLCRHEGDVVVVDGHTGDVIIALPESPDRPRLAGFSEEGHRLFVVYGPCSVRVWDVATGEPTTPLLTESATRIEGATFSADARFLIASDNEPKRPDLLLVWDLASNTVRRISLPNGFQDRQALSLVATRNLVAVPTDVFVGAWSLEDGHPKYPQPRHADGMLNLRLSPDATKLLSSSRDHTARIWDANTGEPLTDSLKHNASVVVAEFSPDGQRVVTCSSDGEIAIWSVDDGKRVLPTLRHPDPLSAARFTPDGRKLVTASSRGGVRVWDFAAALSAPTLTRSQSGWWIKYCAFASLTGADSHLIVSGLSPTVQIYDLQTKTLATPRVQHDFCLTHSQFDSQSQNMFTASFAGEISLSNVKTGKPVFRNQRFRMFPTGQKGLYIRFNDCGLPFISATVNANLESVDRFIVFSQNYPEQGERFSRLAVLDAETGDPIAGPIEFEQPINASVVTPNESHWVGAFGRPSGDYRGSRIEIRTLPGLELVRTLSFEHTVWDVKVGRDARLLLVGVGRRDAPGFARVFDFATGQPLTPPMHHQGPVIETRFLAEDTRLLSNSRDGVVRVWDSLTGLPAAPEIRLGRWICGLAVHPDELWLATGTGTNNPEGTAEQYLRYWDLATGEPISPPMPHGSTIHSVAFSSDGRHVATGGRDAHVRVFRIPHETRSTEDLAGLISVVSGVQLDESDTLVSIDAGTFQQHWTDLYSRYPDDFRVLDDESNAWYRQQLDRAFAEGDLVTAVEYLNRLIVLAPQDPELYRRRIEFHKLLRRSEAVPPDVETVARLSWLTGGELALLALEASDLSPNVAELNRFATQVAERAVAQAPDEPDAWRYLASLHRRTGDRESAEADLEKAVSLQPQNFRSWYELALLQLDCGDRAAYQRTCRRMVGAVPPSNAPAIEQFVTWTCSLGDAQVEDWPAIVRRAKFAVEYQPASIDYRSALGAAYLRAGMYGNAYRELIEADGLLDARSSSMPSFSWPHDMAHFCLSVEWLTSRVCCPAYPWFLLAITCQRLGLSQEAQTWYQKAVDWSDQMQPPVWHLRVTLALLHNEAKQALLDESFDESDPQVWLGRAAVHDLRGEAELSEAASSRAAEYSGESP